MKKRKVISRDMLVAKILSYGLVSIFALLCALPFWLILSGSFTANESIIRNGFGLIPKEFSLEAYRFAFKNPQEILSAYKVSIIVTAVGTVLSVFIMSMTAYVLGRKEYKHRNKFAFYFFFPTMFSGGLIPWYILCVRYLHFKQLPYMAMILPMVFNFFYVVILRSFMSEIPESIVDSAKIDGAGHFYIYLKIILPLSKPAIATIVLFTAMGYWNDYYNPMLFVSKEEYIPLQYYLYRVINSMKNVSSEMLSSVGIISYPTESFKMAMTLIAIGPILLLYPFVQKYLVKGVTVGAVKG